ncbi:MAG: hypothetical protein QOE05_3636 [Actinomycetota bacterium]|jgi:hypothetical protein|nr:hypothetical protein [Actinomycetota bacterium]
MTARGALLLTSLALAALVGMTACSGSSGGDADAGPTTPAAAEPSEPAEPSPAVLVAQPAPAGFPTGEYNRTLHLQGDLDGRWRWLLNPDGTYDFISPENTHLTGTYEVAAGRMTLHDALCGVGTYTVKTTAKGLALAEVSPDPCDEERHALLAGWEWTRAT